MNKTDVKLDLGSGFTKPAGWIGIDKVQWGNQTDIVMDLDSPTVNLGFGDDSVTDVRAIHFLEHIHNILPLMNEIWRVLMPGGKLDIIVPLAGSRGSFDDPEHVRFFSEGTFSYFTPEAPGNYLHPDTRPWKIEINDWTPQYEETDTVIIYHKMRELHVIMTPIKGEENEN